MNWNVAAYLRLSKEEFYGDKNSNSISNQKQIIDSYIKEKNNLKLINYYIDDGYSGTDFNRPGFKKLLVDIKEKKVNTIIVKDLSRLGRNHIEVDNYLENIFPMMNVRFISIIENIDSYENPESLDNYIVPIKNLMNDAYAKDISKKVKSVLKTKKVNGEFVGAFAPYGYKKSLDDNHKFVKDMEASYYVLLIFNGTLKGETSGEIANELNKRNILTPEMHIREKILGKSSNDINERWNAKMVTRILKNRTYIGDLIQGKKKVESYRNHKLIDTNEEDWIITKNHHEPIISEEKFNKVQEIIENNNARINKDSKVDLFYGYLKCGDCGSKFKKSGEYYYCESYARYKKCTKHSINRNKLIRKVEENMKRKNKNIKVLDRKVLFQLIDNIIIFDNGNIKIIIKKKEVKLMNNNEEKLPKVNINWYPGHMAKTRRQIEEDLKIIDIVIELLDARIPISSQNPDIANIIKGKKKIVVLNKCDLADEKQNQIWVQYFEKKGIVAVLTDSNSGKGIEQCIRKIESIMNEDMQLQANKGRTGRKIRAMILGIPNVGKSSFINRISKRTTAGVGNKPGVTKQKQWIRINDKIELLDTPGVLWPKFESEEVALNLAFTGTIKEDILERVDIAYYLTKFLIENNRTKLCERYKITEKLIEEKLLQEQPENENIYEIMLEIGKKRGCIISGGKIDEEKTARILLDEFKNGVIGKITIECPK